MPLGRGTVISVPDFEAWVVSAQSRRGKMPFSAFETDLVDGRWLWMTETVDRSGWMLCIANDITHLRADERTLRQDRDFALKASQTDELTGISNRRYMMAQLEAMIRSQPAGGPVNGCISILDIDFFKGINDLYGHQTGDEILLGLCPPGPPDRPAARLFRPHRRRGIHADLSGDDAGRR